MAKVVQFTDADLEKIQEMRASIADIQRWKQGWRVSGATFSNTPTGPSLAIPYPIKTLPTKSQEDLGFWARITSGSQPDSEVKRWLYEWERVRPTDSESWDWTTIEDEPPTGTARNSHEIATGGDAPAANTRQMPEGSIVWMRGEYAEDESTAYWFSATAACCDPGLVCWYLVRCSIDCEGDPRASIAAVLSKHCDGPDAHSTEWTPENADTVTYADIWIKSTFYCPDGCGEGDECESCPDMPDALMPDLPTDAQIDLWCGERTGRCWAEWRRPYNCATQTLGAWLGSPPAPYTIRCAPSGTYSTDPTVQSRDGDNLMISVWKDLGASRCASNDDCSSAPGLSTPPADPTESQLAGLCSDDCSGTWTDVATEEMDGATCDWVSYGTQAAGTYRLAYVTGAFKPGDAGIFDQYYGGGLLIEFDGGGSTTTTGIPGDPDPDQSVAEANASGYVSGAFSHVGGTIRARVDDLPNNADNTNGTPGPTYKLQRCVP